MRWDSWEELQGILAGIIKKIKFALTPITIHYTFYQYIPVSMEKNVQLMDPHTIPKEYPRGMKI